MSQALLWAAGGTGFTFFMTTLGAAVVFFFRKKVNIGIQRIFLGFAAGVMIAASIWSLLIPAIDQAEKAGGIGWIPAAGGFVLGILFWSGSIPFCPTCIPEQKTRRAFPPLLRGRRFSFSPLRCITYRRVWLSAFRLRSPRKTEATRRFTARPWRSPSA